VCAAGGPPTRPGLPARYGARTARTDRLPFLGHVVGAGGGEEEQWYEAMDWLLSRQERLEDQLAGPPLPAGAVVRYAGTSTCCAGRHGPLARYGHAREERPGHGPIAFGLWTEDQGRPAAGEGCAGHTGNPNTVATQIRPLRQRFRLKAAVLVGDRGRLTSARLREELETEAGVRGITARKAPPIRPLAWDGNWPWSWFGPQDRAARPPPADPGERWRACRPP
jgi:hypothetical protein